MTFYSMTLIFPQIKFEATPSKDVEGVAFQAEADMSYQILGFYHNSFYLVAPMALILNFFTPNEETFPNMYTLPPRPSDLWFSS